MSPSDARSGLLRRQINRPGHNGATTMAPGQHYETVALVDDQTLRFSGPSGHGDCVGSWQTSGSLLTRRSWPHGCY
jgi:hypothetical protein